MSLHIFFIFKYLYTYNLLSRNNDTPMYIIKTDHLVLDNQLEWTSLRRRFLSLLELVCYWSFQAKIAILHPEHFIWVLHLQKACLDWVPFKIFSLMNFQFISNIIYMIICRGLSAFPCNSLDVLRITVELFISYFIHFKFFIILH